MRKFAIVLVLIALPVAAQNVDIEALSGLQFNFGNPGARSLGMGGAFLGLADDASATEANPAGLTILRKPEVSVEVRNYLEQQLFTTSGTFPEVIRTPFTHYSDRVVVSFASAVFPIKNKFTIGAYYHEPLNNEGGGVVAPTYDELTGQQKTGLPDFYLPIENGVPIGGPISELQCEARRRETNNPFSCFQYIVDPFVSVLSVRERTFGVTGAWQIHPKFSIGATVRQQRFQESAATFRFSQQFETKAVVIQATAREKGGQVDLVEETDTTFAAGFKWSPMDKVSVGGVYKKGPTFKAPLFFADASTQFEFINAAETSFHIPDIMGLGVSVRPIQALTVNVDAVRVKYSNLVDDFVATVSDVRDLAENPFVAEDATEVHVGAEYFVATKTPFALRAGYWRDPAHSVEWRGPLTRPDFVAEALLYPPGEAQNHISVGAGIAFSRFQLDAAYDSSKHYKVGSLSMVTRF